MPSLRQRRGDHAIERDLHAEQFCFLRSRHGPLPRLVQRVALLLLRLQHPGRPELDLADEAVVEPHHDLAVEVAGRRPLPSLVRDLEALAQLANDRVGLVRALDVEAAARGVSDPRRRFAALDLVRDAVRLLRTGIDELGTDDGSDLVAGRRQLLLRGRGCGGELL